MKVDVLLGLQWGDEGKGKVVDVLTPRYDVVARFQGGPNAGHTLEFEGQKYVLRSIPSGIFQGDKVNIIGNGVVLDPLLFKGEAVALEASGHPLKERLHISKKAHLIMPTHRVLDAAYEAAKGDAKVGTTGKGIGPTYTDKVSRNGLRVGDILHNFDVKYAQAKARHEQILKSMNFEYDITELEKEWLEAIEYLKEFHLVDSEHEINGLLREGKSVLCEGAQGTLLDVDFGSYPFVTSSNTICAGACTGLGIGPTYTDKVSRNGLRVGDILCNFEAKYAAAKARHEQILKSMNYEYDITELEKEWLEAIDYLREFHLVDSEHEINGLLREGKSVLCEGAQGTLLDVDFGSYPFVTSSNTVCAGACTGLGIGPNKIGNVYGIMKAYCTRVGSGPFPTELFDETGKTIRDLGHEYGAVTGRERRCGWIDLVALKYAIMVNGVTHLIMMKSDVLDGFDTIKACVAYNVNGEEVDYFPYDITEGVEPIYVELPGWKTDMTKMTSEDEFPEEFNAYVTFLEEQLETPIKIISVGPDRAQTIERYTEE